MTGVVLAGGLGRRMGAPKATASLAGKPLIAYPLAALAGVCKRVVVVAKSATELPDLGVERWDEPAEPQHPRAGLTYALERTDSPILVCAADMPFVTRETLRRLADGLQPGVTAAIASADGHLQPLLGGYTPAALDIFRAAPRDEPLRRTVETLAPVLFEVEADEVFNVNTPEDLAEAEQRLRS